MRKLEYDELGYNDMQQHLGCEFLFVPTVLGDKDTGLPIESAQQPPEDKLSRLLGASTNNSVFAVGDNARTKSNAAVDILRRPQPVVLIKRIEDQLSEETRSLAGKQKKKKRTINRRDKKIRSAGKACASRNRSQNDAASTDVTLSVTVQSVQGLANDLPDWVSENDQGWEIIDVRGEASDIYNRGDCQLTAKSEQFRQADITCPSLLATIEPSDKSKDPLHQVDNDDDVITLYSEEGDVGKLCMNTSKKKFVTFNDSMKNGDRCLPGGALKEISVVLDSHTSPTKRDRILEPLFQQLGEVERIADTICIIPSKTQVKSTPSPQNKVLVAGGIQTEFPFDAKKKPCNKEVQQDDQTRGASLSPSMPCLTEESSSESFSIRNLNLTAWKLEKIDVGDSKTKKSGKRVEEICAKQPAAEKCANARPSKEKQLCVQPKGKDLNLSVEQKRQANPSSGFERFAYRKHTSQLSKEKQTLNLPKHVNSLMSKPEGKYRQNTDADQPSKESDRLKDKQANLPPEKKRQEQSNSKMANTLPQDSNSKSMTSFNRAPKKFFQSKHNAMESMKEKGQQLQATDPPTLEKQVNNNRSSVGPVKEQTSSTVRDPCPAAKNVDRKKLIEFVPATAVKEHSSSCEKKTPDAEIKSYDRTEQKKLDPKHSDCVSLQHQSNNTTSSHTSGKNRDVQHKSKFHTNKPSILKESSANCSTSSEKGTVCSVIKEDRAGNAVVAPKPVQPVRRRTSFEVIEELRKTGLGIFSLEGKMGDENDSSISEKVAKIAEPPKPVSVKRKCGELENADVEAVRKAARHNERRTSLELKDMPTLTRQDQLKDSKQRKNSKHKKEGGHLLKQAKKECQILQRMNRHVATKSTSKPQATQIKDGKPSGTSSSSSSTASSPASCTETSLPPQLHLVPTLAKGLTIDIPSAKPSESSPKPDITSAKPSESLPALDISSAKPNESLPKLDIANAAGKKSKKNALKSPLDSPVPVPAGKDKEAKIVSSRCDKKSQCSIPARERYMLNVSDISSEEDEPAKKLKKSKEPSWRSSSFPQDKVTATKFRDSDPIAVYQEKTQQKRMAKDLPRFNWLEEKIRNGDLTVTNLHKVPSKPESKTQHPSCKQPAQPAQEINNDGNAVAVQENTAHPMTMQVKQLKPREENQNCQKADVVQEALNASGLHLSSPSSGLVQEEEQKFDGQPSPCSAVTTVDVDLLNSANKAQHGPENKHQTETNVERTADQAKPLKMSKATLVPSLSVSTHSPAYSVSHAQPITAVAEKSTVQVAGNRFAIATAAATSTEEQPHGRAELTSTSLDSVTSIVKNVASTTLHFSTNNDLSAGQQTCEQIERSQPISLINPPKEHLALNVKNVTPTCVASAVAPFKMAQTSVPSQVSVICTGLFSDEDEKALSVSATCGSVKSSNARTPSTIHATATHKGEDFSYVAASQPNVSSKKVASNSVIQKRALYALNNGHQQTATGQLPVGNKVVVDKTQAVLTNMNQQHLSQQSSMSILPSDGRQFTAHNQAIHSTQPNMPRPGHAPAAPKTGTAPQAYSGQPARKTPETAPPAACNVNGGRGLLPPQSAATRRTVNSYNQHAHLVPADGKLLPPGHAGEKMVGHPPVAPGFGAFPTGAMGVRRAPEPSHVSVQALPSNCPVVDEERCHRSRPNEVTMRAFSGGIFSNQAKNPLEDQLEQMKREVGMLDALAAHQENERNKILKLKLEKQRQLKTMEMQQKMHFSNNVTATVAQPQPTTNRKRPSAEVRPTVSDKRPAQGKSGATTVPEFSGYSSNIYNMPYSGMQTTAVHQNGGVIINHLHAERPFYNNYQEQQMLANQQLVQNIAQQHGMTQVMPNNLMQGMAQVLQNNEMHVMTQQAMQKNSMHCVTHDNAKLPSPHVRPETATNEQCTTCTAVVGSNKSCLVRGMGMYQTPNVPKVQFPSGPPAHPVALQQRQSPTTNGNFHLGHLAAAHSSQFNSDQTRNYFQNSAEYPVPSVTSSSIPSSSSSSTLKTAQPSPTMATKNMVGFMPVTSTINPFVDPSQQYNNHVPQASQHHRLPPPANYPQQYSHERSNTSHHNVLSPQARRLSQQEVQNFARHYHQGSEIPTVPLTSSDAGNLHERSQNSQGLPPNYFSAGMQQAGYLQPTADNPIICKMCRGNANFMCSRCKSVQYCSQKCQMDDWTNHCRACMAHAVKEDVQS